MQKSDLGGLALHLHTTLTSANMRYETEVTDEKVMAP